MWKVSYKVLDNEQRTILNSNVYGHTVTTVMIRLFCCFFIVLHRISSSFYVVVVSTYSGWLITVRSEPHRPADVRRWVVWCVVL